MSEIKVYYYIDNKNDRNRYVKLTGPNPTLGNLKNVLEKKLLQNRIFSYDFDDGTGDSETISEDDKQIPIVNGRAICWLEEIKPQDQSQTIANVAHHAIKHSPVTPPRLAIESFPQLNIDHSASVVELMRPIVLVNKYLRTGLFKEVYKLHYSSELATSMLPQVEIRFSKYEGKLDGNHEVLAWVYRKPPLEQKTIYIDKRFCNAMDIACESQKTIIEFYITMLIIHELGHIFTRWKTGQQYSPGNLQYCQEPEAGYFLQNKLFDCIVRVSGSSSDLCSWNEETRLYGVVKQKFSGSTSSPEPFLYTYIDESYIKDALDGKIESSQLLPLKDKLGPDGKPLMMREGEHAMFSNNKCTDDVCNPSPYNLVEADPSTLLKGDI